MKKGMSNIFVLVLVLVNLILTIVLVFTFVPSINKTNNLVNKICEIVDLNVGDNNGNNGDAITVADLDSRSVKFGTGRMRPRRSRSRLLRRRRIKRLII